MFFLRFGPAAKSVADGSLALLVGGVQVVSVLLDAVMKTVKGE